MQCLALLCPYNRLAIFLDSIPIFAFSFLTDASMEKAYSEYHHALNHRTWKSYSGIKFSRCFINYQFNRLVVIRRPYQVNMFFEEDVSLKYMVIATNRVESSEWVVAWYNQRGDCIENRIKRTQDRFWHRTNALWTI